MELIINGDKKVLEDASTLSDLVGHYGMQDKMVVAEVDGEVVERDRWLATTLRDGMRIELVHFVGGG